jgi:SAM-dependent methyltransferase
MYDTVSPHTSGLVIEIGSGIGNISQYYIRDGRQIMLSDIREVYCRHLQTTFGHQPNVMGIENIDLVKPNFATAYASHLNRYDSLFALNVVEHIKDDTLAIANAKLLLKSGGKMVILVPAYQSLYNSFDKGLEHYRRYTFSSLKNLLIQNDLEVIHGKYFNFAGILGWYVSGSLLKHKEIPSGEIKLFNKLVPVFKAIDTILMRKIGLSVIAVGVKA